MRRNNLPALVIVVALLSATLAGAALVAPTGAQDANSEADANADRTVAVDATGTADAAPDRVVVRVAVTAEGDGPSVVRDNLTRGADALREEFEAASISTDQYETDEYRIDERRDEFPPYRGTHRFVVRLDDPQRAGDVIDAAANVSAEVQTVRFTLSEDRRTDLRERAIEDAMADARSQADTVAANGGLQVTSVVAVDASQQRYRPVEYEAAAPLTASDGGSTSVETGDVSVRYQVRVTYNATRA